MPEGHTLHKWARKQAPLFVGERVAVRSPQGRFERAAAIDGGRITAIDAFGKHLLYTFERRGVTRILHVHLGLAGRFKVKRSPAKPSEDSVRLRIEGPRHTLELRGPRVCELLTPAARDALLARLGPDPIRARTSPTRLRARLALTRVPVGAMLLDQSAVAGIGNVYRAEILFLAGIDPRRPSRDVTREEVETIWKLARRLLRAGIVDGRIVTTKYGGVVPAVRERDRPRHARRPDVLLLSSVSAGAN